MLGYEVIFQSYLLTPNLTSKGARRGVEVSKVTPPYRGLPNYLPAAASFFTDEDDRI